MKKLFIAFCASAIFLASSCGNTTSQPESTSTTVSSAAPASGAAIYNRTCITCHQAGGEGIPNTYPPLAKSDFIKDKEKTIEQVIKGYTGELTVNGAKYNSNMPAQQLNDDEIAAVLTYVYANFGNSGDAITASAVKAVRDKIK